MSGDPISLGRSDLQVEQFSLGTAAIGGMYRSVEDSVAADLIVAAFDAGIRYFDTAPQYGHGVAETRLGRALAGRDRDSFIVSSKVGRLVVDSAERQTGIFADASNSATIFAFDRDSVLRSIDESLIRLGLDRLDMVLIHDPDDFADQAIDESYPTLHELREQGVIRAIGVGMNQSAIPARFIRETEIDAVLLAGRYTLLDQEATHELIPAARQHGVSIVVGGVFNSGILVDPDVMAMYDYAPAVSNIVKRARELKAICGRHGVELAHAALAFPLRERAVATVLLGARDRTELMESLERDLVSVPDDLWAELADRGLIHELQG